MKNQRTNRSNRKNQKQQTYNSNRGLYLSNKRTIVAVVAVLVLAIGLYTIAVKNVPGVNPYQAHAIPGSRVCTIASTTLCLNRKGGGTAPKTPIIGWYNVTDNHNNFQFVTMPYYCDHGHVRAATATNIGCPFTTATMNNGNKGRVIVKIQEQGVSNPLCVGDQDGNGAADLAWCPDADGAHGSWGTQFIAMQTSWSKPQINATQLVNVFWSDNPNGGAGRQGRWMCTKTSGTSIFLTWFQAIDSTCGYLQTNYYQPM